MDDKVNSTSHGGTPMKTQIILFRPEIANFISASERVQSMLAQGERLSSDEADVVRFCAVEILEKVAEPFSTEHHS